MRTKVSLFFLIVICLILQCTLMPAISIASVTPNLMISLLSIVLYYYQFQNLHLIV